MSVDWPPVWPLLVVDFFVKNTIYTIHLAAIIYTLHNPVCVWIAVLNIATLRKLPGNDEYDHVANTPISTGNDPTLQDTQNTSSGAGDKRSPDPANAEDSPSKKTLHTIDNPLDQEIEDKKIGKWARKSPRIGIGSHERNLKRAQPVCFFTD